MPFIFTQTGDRKLEYLKSKHKVLFTCMVNSGTVAADGNGDRILRPGTIMARITAPILCSGSCGPYDENATDGRAVPIGILNDYINLRHGHVESAILMEGHVYELRIYRYDTQTYGNIPNAIKNALRSSTTDVHFQPGNPGNSQSEV